MSIYYVSGIPYSSDELYHHGIKGQKWGERRFQNKDGTLTEAGKKRYGSYKFQDPVKLNSKGKKELEEFEEIRNQLIGRDGEEQVRGYNRIQKMFDEKFNDSTFTEYGGNIPKNDDAYNGLRELERAYNRTRGVKSGLTYNEKTGSFEKDEKQYKKYKKVWDYYNRVADDFAGKALTSIGYEDTEEARHFIQAWFQLRG